MNTIDPKDIHILYAENITYTDFGVRRIISNTSESGFKPDRKRPFYIFKRPRRKK